MNRRHRKRCAALTTDDLRTLIETLEPEVRMAVSLLECARQELRKRRPSAKRSTTIPPEV
jgi:hypothetical protein